MSVICKDCGKRMPTQVILDLHMKKRHGGDNGEVKTVIKPEEKVEIKTESGVTGNLEKVAYVIPEGETVIESVDGRELEVSVGSVIWRGKTITVPNDMVEEVRRLLETGGFFIK